MDLKRQEENFKNHVATFVDYGNIKILDLKILTVLIIESGFCLKKIIANYT